MVGVPDPIHELALVHRGPEPCPYCAAADCKAFPDPPVRPDYPFLPAPPPPPAETTRRRRARHGPAETRHHPAPGEDR